MYANRCKIQWKGKTYWWFSSQSSGIAALRLETKWCMVLPRIANWPPHERGRSYLEALVIFPHWITCLFLNVFLLNKLLKTEFSGTSAWYPLWNQLENLLMLHSIMLNSNGTMYIFDCMKILLIFSL